jgi:hypothetical protein
MEKTPPPFRAMGFETSCQLRLNLDRRAAGQQRVEHKSQVQIVVHAITHTPERRPRQPLFLAASA